MGLDPYLYILRKKMCNDRNTPRTILHFVLLEGKKGLFYYVLKNWNYCDNPEGNNWFFFCLIKGYYGYFIVHKHVKNKKYFWFQG